MTEKKTKEVQKWSDVAMFASEPLDARTGPSVHLLNAPADPLGAIAAMALMYKGVVVRDLADVTDEQRREMFAQICQTKLKAPFEAVTFHWMVEGVTRSLTHQMVRQRTAVFAQESLRFAVVEDGFAERTSLPPSLAGTRGGETKRVNDEWVAQTSGVEVVVSDPEDPWMRQLKDAYDRVPENERWRDKWEKAVAAVEAVYGELVNAGMPAEDARGLLPHNITTRLNYVTNLRNFQDHGGNRLCTQAQFEWRALWIAFVKELRAYGRKHTYTVNEAMVPGGTPSPVFKSSCWQYDLIADLFRPVCYLTGKCEFAAMDLDRKCKIRDRVDANHAAGRPSSFWHTHGNGNLKPIDPREWLADPGAAR